uniref:Uncharacterized protein n=2 Tax=unclassified Caudoviricetes TaxID=2788787 RepID=A0A8S5Q8V6_9CAUD|nr:MAG TPA: hypothetical protein [Siphoviridae sp. ctAvK3]DAE15189.1 MAG TPA: hypothetical protein [Siphoviridae sp. ctdVv30]
MLGQDNYQDIKMFARASRPRRENGKSALRTLIFSDIGHS